MTKKTGFYSFLCLVIVFCSAYTAEKKWVNVVIRSLLLTAGIGYVIQYSGMVLAANPLKFATWAEPVFIVLMMLAEISYAVWKVIKGGKARKLTQN